LLDKMSALEDRNKLAHEKADKALELSTAAYESSLATPASPAPARGANVPACTVSER